MYRNADQAAPAAVDQPSTDVLDVVETDLGDESDTVMVHVALRPRRGSARRCLAGLAALAAAHPEVAVSVTGLGKDERVVRITIGVELGPRAGVARFSPQAQAAYTFVCEVFTTLYDHMPVYSGEPSAAERGAAASLMAGLGAGADDAAFDAVPLPRSPLPTARASV